MDLFSNIDLTKLKIIISDVKLIIENYNDVNAKDKLELLKLLYEIEKELTKVKTQFELPSLNSEIDSNSVIYSFANTPSDKKVFDDLSVYDDFFRQNDYQYWLLIFLLIKNNDIRQKNLTLFQIIDEFVSRVKEESFTWRDIELTSTGATRCKTNLRFAYNDLKKIGLVNLYDQNHKQSWSLTYLGFFLAASFCFNPEDKHLNPFSKTITRFHQSTYYFKVNKVIWQRVKNLSNPAPFIQLVSRLKLNSLGLPELEKGPEIFNDYYEYVTELHSGDMTKEEREKSLDNYLEALNKNYPLEYYMEELSLKFDAEAFFSELIQKVNTK